MDLTLAKKKKKKPKRGSSCCKACADKNVLIYFGTFAEALKLDDEEGAPAAAEGGDSFDIDLSKLGPWTESDRDYVYPEVCCMLFCCRRMDTSRLVLCGEFCFRGSAFVFSGIFLKPFSRSAGILTRVRRSFWIV